MSVKKIFIVIIVFLLTGCSSISSSTNIPVEQLQEYSKGNSQIVAIIDTGLSENLQNKYKNRIVKKFNAINKSKKVNDDIGHGDIVTSFIVDKTEGISPNSNIILIKAFEKGVQTDSKVLFNAIKYAIDSNANIINLSFGSYKEDKNIKKLIKEGLEKDINFVVSTGDYGEKDLLFPSNVKGVISVQSKDKENKLWEFSNTSHSVILTMPGVNIKSEISKQKVSGTSYSAALATGYIALIKDYYYKNGRKLKNSELIKILKNINSKGATEYLEPFDAFKE